MDVAIVICTHRRPALLAGAVQSVIEQSRPLAAYEVIIVDNDSAPNPDVQKVVKNASQKIPIQYVHEREIGLSRARNAGGMRASAKYLCFIDDDAKLSSKYLETLLEIITVHKPDICGGPYYPFYLDSKPDWFSDKYGSNNLGENARYLNKNEYLTGGNIVFKKNLLCELGWFDPSLGKLGSKLRYGEETKLLIDAWNANPRLKVYYEPNLFVYHLVPAWKMRLLNMVRISYQTGKSQVYIWIPKEQRHSSRLHAPLATIIDLMLLSDKLLRGIVLRNRQVYAYWQNFIVEEICPTVVTISSNLRLAKDLLFLWKKESSDL